MSELEIRHDATAQRFETHVEGHVAVVDYTLEGGIMTITHTGVPEAIGGRGVASELVRVALDHARASGWRVHPQCPYAAVWIRRHPDYADLVA